MLPRALVTILVSWSLLQGQTTTPPDPDKLEARVESNPDDVLTRAQLVRAASNTNNTAISPARAKELRRKHILWLIEHKPGASVLGEPMAVIEKSGGPLSDAEAWSEADRLWRSQIGAGAAQEVFLNAFTFYRPNDLAYARKVVEEGLAAHPRNQRLATAKGGLLAFTLLGIKQVDRFGQASGFDDAILKSEEATRARRELAATHDAIILGGAAEALDQQQGALSRRNRTAEMNKAADLAESLYLLAAEFDPVNARWKSGLASHYWTSASRIPVGSQKVALLEKALRLAGDGQPRGYVLADLAQAYFGSGDTTKAAETANQLLALPKSESNYGNAIHTGNIVLGRIAFKKGELKDAGQRLLAAGNTPGSPVLNSFGPNWNLAQELLGKGERDTVLAYIELCRKFWKLDRGRLDTWAASIREGSSVNFLGPPPITTPQLTGRAAPEFRVRSLRGGEVSLADFKGKVVLVDFWATWCGPCVQEMPTFEKLHRELSTKDVVILAVDVNEPDDLVKEYIDKQKFTFPVLLSQGSDIAAKYGVEAYPTLVAIDEAGLVADYVIGGRSEANLREVIEKARGGARIPSTISTTNIPVAVTAEDSYRDAVRLHAAKDLQGAIAALDRVIQMNPRMDAAWTLRGQCNLGLRRQPEAIADLTRAIELSSERAAALVIRGEAYVANNQVEQALADFAKALVIDPANGLALEGRSGIHVMRKRYAEAIADCDAVLRSAPATSWAMQRKNEIRGLMSGRAGGSSLPAPVLVSPAAGAVFSINPRETALVWSEVPGAVSYVVEWDYKGAEWASEQRGTSGVIIRSSQPRASFNFIGAQQGRAGAEGAKSDWREFTYTK